MSADTLPSLAEAATDSVPAPTLMGLQQVRSASEIVWYDFHARQFHGLEPFVRELRTDTSIDAARLLPADAVVERRVYTELLEFVLARGPGVSMMISTSPRWTEVEISSADLVILEQVTAEIRSRIPDRHQPDTVEIRTWYKSGPDISSSDQPIETPEWSEIRRNYPAAAGSALDRVMGLERPHGRGKLLLWHGPPGTGKTTALRALMRQWQPWCATQYIADPERLFSEPTYILEVLTRPPQEERRLRSLRVAHDRKRWQLIVAEDCDEYLRASARRDAGAALGRLLNLTDGILGQGFDTLVLLTTNEELNRLHPALTRPGRCLAQLEFPMFTTGEARAWLPEHLRHQAHPATLAELLAIDGSLDPIGNNAHPPDRVGQYL